MPHQPAHSRRDLLKHLALGAVTLGLGGLPRSLPAEEGGGRGQPPNLLFFTVDDMDFHSLNATGCSIPGLTPHLDRLLGEGVTFLQGHVGAAVCQPSRATMLTGRYPHRNGVTGFNPINDDCPMLPEILHQAGYLNGILSKEMHVAPAARCHWSQCWTQKEAKSRDPAAFAMQSRAFFTKAAESRKPFFLMANTNAPHRPFQAGLDRFAMDLRPDQVDLPPFLPDLPDIRSELAQYFASVSIADRTIGAILDELKRSGMEGDTLVVFLSDNGMAFPFAKSNCYRASTRTPITLRWPGHLKPRVDRDHFVTSMDLLPTIMELLGLPAIGDADGRSLVPLCAGARQPDRSGVYTVFNSNHAGSDYCMRAVHNARYAYIYNGWVENGRKTYQMENMAGLSWKAMLDQAKTDEVLARRTALYLQRPLEEFYDYDRDPGALVNLAADPASADLIRQMRQQMRTVMTATQDPELRRFTRLVA